MEKSIWLESCEKMWRQQCHLQYDQLVNNSITKIWIVCTYCIVNDPNSICFIQGVVNYASSLGLGCTHLLVCSSSFLVGQIQIRVRQSLSSDLERFTPQIEGWTPNTNNWDLTTFSRNSQAKLISPFTFSVGQSDSRILEQHTAQSVQLNLQINGITIGWWFMG